MTPPPGATIATDASVPGGFGVPVALSRNPASEGFRPLALGVVGQLLRPRITVMVLATVVAAAWLTAGRTIDPGRLVLLLAGTALVAASSSIANQILERDTDRLMPRTAGRPLAAGTLVPSTAWWLAGGGLVAGLLLAVAGGGAGAAVAALVTWLLYVIAYTPLKRRSPLNTAVGAVPGALPVMIGWLGVDGPARFAAGDSAGAVAVAALTAVLYLWQFPHFMAIAWLYRRQYEAAGLRMLTVTDPSGGQAGIHAVCAALAMVPASLTLAVPSARWPLFVGAAILAGVYVLAAIRFAVRRDDRSARGLLLVSLVVLLGLLVASVGCGPPRS
jgi:protoheme IX farnesyltransferase